MKSLPFTKLHGLGNDFIVIDSLTPSSPNAKDQITPELARKLCDRRFGIGADQILWLNPPQNKNNSAKMDILNPDGSTAEMCGNGIRAAAVFLQDHGPNPGQSSYAIETLGGLKKLNILPPQGKKSRQVLVDMEKAKLLGGFSGDAKGEAFQIPNRTLQLFEVNMGNPHAVFFLPQDQDLWKFPLEEVGPAVENHSRFPNRTNVEIVKVTGDHAIEVRVWERGTGITLACGTGACASAVASMATQRVKGPVTVKLPGGELTIRWDGPVDPVWMEGPAVEVFRGEFFQR